MNGTLKFVRKVPFLVAAGRSVRSHAIAAGSGLRRSWPALDWACQDSQRYGRISAPLALRRPGVRLVPVLGMHRSGTSCVTGILAENGLHLSDDLIKPNQFNPEGFWESKEVISINRDLLNRFNYDYANPDAIVTRFPRRLLRRAERYLLRLATRPVAGWKDPRMVITWPAWYELLYKVPHIVVVCFRHPRNVANSFALSAAEDGLCYESALTSWYKYNSAIAAIFSDVVLINFDEPLEYQIEYACGRIGLEFKRESMSLYKPKLIHNGQGDLSSGSDEADSLYELLLSRWRSQRMARAPERLNAP